MFVSITALLLETQECANALKKKIVTITLQRILFKIVYVSGNAFMPPLNYFSNYIALKLPGPRSDSIFHFIKTLSSSNQT